MTKTAIVSVINPTTGDKITLSDTRGITYSFQLDTEEHRRTDLTCVPVQIGKTLAATANNLYRKAQPLLAINSTVSDAGALSLEQKHEGDVEPIAVTGDSFSVVQDWA
jgi:hypothetical protein